MTNTRTDGFGKFSVQCVASHGNGDRARGEKLNQGRGAHISESCSGQLITLYIEHGLTGKWYFGGCARILVSFDMSVVQSNVEETDCINYLHFKIHIGPKVMTREGSQGAVGKGKALNKPFVITIESVAALNRFQIVKQTEMIQDPEDRKASITFSTGASVEIQYLAPLSSAIALL
jgi:hypothetical protein